MKSIALTMAVLILSGTLRAEESHYWRENEVPSDIHTEADLTRYEGYRKNLTVGAAGLLVGSVLAFKVSRIYAAKAGRVRTTGNVYGVPVAGGGTQWRQTVLLGNVERQRRYFSKRNAWKTAGQLGILAALTVFTLSLNFRF